MCQQLNVNKSCVILDDLRIWLFTKLVKENLLTPEVFRGFDRIESQPKVYCKRASS